MKREIQYLVKGEEFWQRRDRVGFAAYCLRMEGHEAHHSVRESPAGSWASDVFIVTNAPVARLRHYLGDELTAKRTAK